MCIVGVAVGRYTTTVSTDPRGPIVTYIDSKPIGVDLGALYSIHNPSSGIVCCDLVCFPPADDMCCNYVMLATFSDIISATKASSWPYGSIVSTSCA